MCISIQDFVGNFERHLEAPSSEPLVVPRGLFTCYFWQIAGSCTLKGGLHVVLRTKHARDALLCNAGKTCTQTLWSSIGAVVTHACIARASLKLWALFTCVLIRSRDRKSLVVTYGKKHRMARNVSSQSTSPFILTWKLLAEVQQRS